VTRPFVKIPWSMVTEPIWGNDRLLARWIRASADEDRQRRWKRRAYIPPNIWRVILEAFGYRCAYCGTTGPLERDHRVPITKGGTDDPANIVPACKPCNVRKGAADPADWPLLINRRVA
jgi:5-methylcytosine-specific restriction endonuclease McrA